MNEWMNEIAGKRDVSAGRSWGYTRRDAVQQSEAKGKATSQHTNNVQRSTQQSKLRLIIIKSWVNLTELSLSQIMNPI